MTTPVLVIGDIHGRADLLRNLLNKIRRHYGVRKHFLFQMGDLIDRGPDSKDVIQLCIDHNIQSVLGNHETWLHQYLATGTFDSFALHQSMRGERTLRSYGLDSKDPGEIERKLKNLIPKEHQEFILSLPLWRKLEVKGKTYFLNHAGVKRGIANIAQHWWKGSAKQSDEDIMDFIARFSPADILWTSNSFKNPTLYHFKEACQVIGHSPTPRGVPVITNHWIAVDTGCGVRRAVLSALELGTEHFLSVDALSDKGLTDRKFTNFLM